MTTVRREDVKTIVIAAATAVRRVPPV